MFYYVYILIHLNNKDNPTYVGYTKNLTERLKLHNSSKGAKFTRGRFWKIIYKKSYKLKSNAMKFEYALKNNRTLRDKIKKKFLELIK
jgi:putative endonuclease